MSGKSTALRIICTVLVLLLGLQSALAQTYEGETPLETALGVADENGDIVKFRSLTIRWRFAGLMGEPLRQFAGRYEHHSPPWVELAGAPVCFAQHVMASFNPEKIEPDMVKEGALDGVNLYTHSRLRMIIQPNSRVGFAGGPGRTIQHYFGVDSFSQGTDYGPSVPGSPEWDRLFQIGSVGSEDIPWLSEAQTRELFREGFTVSRIDLVDPKYALAQVKASYERHFRSKPCGDRPVEPLAEEEAAGDEPTTEQVASTEARVDDAVEPQGDLTPPAAPPGQPKPQTAADRLDAMLNRVASAREEEKAAAVAHAAYIASLPVEVFEIADGWVTAQGENMSGPYAKGAFLAFENEIVVDYECSPKVVGQTRDVVRGPLRDFVSNNCNVLLKNSRDGSIIKSIMSSDSEWIQYAYATNDGINVVHATRVTYRQCTRGLNLLRCGQDHLLFQCYSTIYNINPESSGRTIRYGPGNDCI
ncbi:hypothetical protein [Devosia sp.]|uniref:hypothetical protein n=1 Tax=Devosia sp. TaxID=1871048 RepID=UPI002732B3D0|nr:hypothetical protein [Devosia sp.]MDP2781895.1 hypothetical protein [Devosia sp.]